MKAFEMLNEGKADKNKLGYVGSVPGSDRDSDSWYTPPMYIESARKVLKGFSLDPFSSDIANATVRANRFITEDEDAFETSWDTSNGSVWMNPPYGRGIVTKAVNRFLDQWEKKKFDRAIILVNNATETKWFQALMKEASLLCFTDHRIAFLSPDEKAVSNNTRGQVFFLFEADSRDRGVRNRFKRQFNKYGTVVKVVI